MSLRPLADRATGGGADARPTLSLLGGFGLDRQDDSAVPLHVRRLLAFLALHRGPLHRAYVSGRLWLELSQPHAFGCLRTALWRLGRLPWRLVETTPTHVALASWVSVDAHELEACAEKVLTSEAQVTRREIATLVHGADLLPDWYEDWVVPERERLRQLRLLGLEAVAEELLASERAPEATVAALAVVGADPLRESAYRLLIRSYLRAGNVGEALRQFGLFRARLQHELGLEPSAQIRALLDGSG